MRLFFILLLLPLVAVGQSHSRNFVKTSIYRDPSAVSNPGLATTNITYFDGLGRPMQTVAAAAGGSGEDIVTPVVYDSYGREVKKYLPLAKAGTLEYHPNETLLDSIYTQYALKFPGDTPATGMGNPYSETVFEPSPLARVLEQAAPGKSWALAQGHTIKNVYATNSQDEVRYFWVSFYDSPLDQLPKLNYGGYYNAGKLYKTVVKNENWNAATDTLDNTTHEFKDQEGRILLKRDFNNEVAYDTYYVYDRYGNLSYVIPPLANDNLISGTGPHYQVTLRSEVVNSLCYQYLYDRRNRVIGKRVPDKGWEYIIYDKLDRPVLTHNAKLSSNEWLFTKYDKLGRVAYTGLWTDPQQLGRYDLQLQVDEYAVTPYESRSATALFATQGAGVNYTCQMFPTANLDIYTVNYYDDYDFSHPGVTVPVATSYGDVLAAPADARNLKGLPTGSVVRTLNTNTWTYTLTGYDAKGRTVWSGQRNNYLAYSQASHSKLDFTGKVTASLTEHTKDAQATREVRDFYIYDNQGRLLRQTQKIGQQAEQLIAYNHYDALGQLDEKKVGRANPAAAYAAVSELQKVQYGYNMRGWLTKINNMQATGLFAFEIAYDQPQAGTALYNGNIAQTKWKTSDNLTRGYTYGYDALNRLTMAGYFGGAAQENYTEGPIAYDKNGNIQSLTRYGLRTAQQDIAKIDGLSYTYQQYSNRLLKVTDDSLVPDGFNNGTSADAQDYAYDANGNMTSDLNKGITGNGIRYNHLNLPRVISFTPGNTIEYLYDANGTKLRKRVTVTSNGTATTTTTDYAGGFIYINGVLQHFANAEGYAAYNVGTNTFSYIYQYKDHLGNSRVSYTEGTNGNAQVVEENSYYAFGLQHKGYIPAPTGLGNAHAEKYKYNGKELNEELGINWYDYGARNYDAAIGRWMNVDPLAEVSRRWSPYSYCYDNPVRFVDPDGMRVNYGEFINNAGEPDYDWDSGTYRSGSVEAALANIRHKTLPPDDITVNSKGIVTNVAKNDKPDRFFDENGKQLYFNDPVNDFSMINEWGVGDQLYHPISTTVLFTYITKGGLSPLVYKSTMNPVGALGVTAFLSWGPADFSGYLRNDYMTNGEDGHTSEDSFTQFFRFGNSQSIYNLYDAGNFMWGAWMHLNDFSGFSSRAGAHVNNFLSTILSFGRRGGGMLDSNEDQRAITNGYNYIRN